MWKITIYSAADLLHSPVEQQQQQLSTNQGSQLITYYSTFQRIAIKAAARQRVAGGLPRHLLLTCL
jgi:hypothetical protein